MGHGETESACEIIGRVGTWGNWECVWNCWDRWDMGKLRVRVKLLGELGHGETESACEIVWTVGTWGNWECVWNYWESWDMGKLRVSVEFWHVSYVFDEKYSVFLVCGMCRTLTAVTYTPDEPRLLTKFCEEHQMGRKPVETLICTWADQ